ncbi:response regulator [Thermodesulforhabdus norvegica]|uniref:Phosphate regulon transcriptional regulatory protein PhoB n=1 Tax=Thermodesulforhabdus norvegica TaxID=39841 RepID=A0A1I4VW27_9BACT|nr:response regulator transcription factor [Thermodesulforhabdus norvegica]SFN05464.1 two-component system, OmpR family, phosphate regulon response regulator PhoB [Thermodesulforhabdus norvegica]
MKGKTIFVVDDEPDLCDLVKLHLEKSDFRVKTFLSATSLLNALQTELPDLIILDLMLPDMDGMDLCRILRKNERTARVPIIMLTARGEVSDRVLGLELGADDYVTKPFSPREIVARVRAVLRRLEQSDEEEILQIGDVLSISPRRFEVLVEGRKVSLTPTEFRILTVLARRKGWVFTREQLLENLWGGEKIVVDRTIDVHIKNLREKLGKAGKLIKSIRGVGYKIEAE